MDECKHNLITPGSLCGVKPGHWSIGGGRFHWVGICDGCGREFWRHGKPDDDPEWQAASVPCGCPDLRSFNPSSEQRPRLADSRNA